MMNECDKLDLSALQKAIRSLTEAYQLVEQHAWFDKQEKILQDTLIAGLIQNFEFVYELSVKMLKRRLEMDAISPDEIDHSNFRDLLRIGAEKGLLKEVNAWFEYRKMRNITSHTYDEDKAKQVCLHIKPFLIDANLLCTELEKRNAD